MDFSLPPVERFEALAKAPVRHGFIGRIPGIDVHTDRATALARLDDIHDRIRQHEGVGEHRFVFGQQVHGHRIEEVDASATPLPVPGVDGLITCSREACLAVYVADCCAVFLVDPEAGSIGLVHSGKKGTEQGIVGRAVNAMVRAHGAVPGRIIAQLSPCIRPPLYEVDFASQIRDQLSAVGVRHIHDCGVCTGADTERYYSYRMEKGRTGRMLAFLALKSGPEA